MVGGLLGKSSARKERSNSIKDTIESLPRLRQSAEKAGFNPLTALMATGGAGFNNIASGAAPLASIQAISGAVQGAADVFTGKKAEDDNRQRVIDDLNSIQLERAKAGKAGMVVERTFERSRPSATMPVSGTAPRLGKQAAEKPNVTFSNVNKDGLSANPVAPGREMEVMPLPNSPGVFEMENTMTNGPITLPGDGEPWGIDEVLTAVTVGGPQILWNQGKKAFEHWNSPKEKEARKAARKVTMGETDDEKAARKAAQPKPGWAERRFGQFHFD